MGLLIVSRDHPECYRRFRYAFADDALLTMLFDRRYGFPQGAGDHPPFGIERRRRDITRQLIKDGWAIVEAAPDAPGPSAPDRAPTARILVVEDDVAVLEMLRSILESAGYQPVVTPDPREALALLATEPFDLVITDLVMPHIDGLALLEKARVRSPRAAVLMISAFGTAKLVREALEKGAADFIAKPFELAPFLETIRGILMRPR